MIPTNKEALHDGYIELEQTEHTYLEVVLIKSSTILLLGDSNEIRCGLALSLSLFWGDTPSLSMESFLI